LIVVTAPELGYSSQDSFMLNILASFAEFEREMIAARIADTRERLKERHLRFAGGVPFGYGADGRSKQLAPKEEESAVVKWMFAEAAAGKKPADIAEAADGLGHRTKVSGALPLCFQVDTICCESQFVRWELSHPDLAYEHIILALSDGC
jgi:DNA invertase Pin-like site-specific DNA recombinase